MVAFIDSQNKEVGRGMRSDDKLFLGVKKSHGDLQLLTAIFNLLYPGELFINSKKYLKILIQEYIKIRDVLEIPNDENKGHADNLRKAYELNFKVVDNNKEYTKKFDFNFYDKNPKGGTDSKGRKRVKFIPGSPNG